ncbi:MAG: oligopeptide/amino acid transporter permease protein [Francisellaceae bacterium]|nr:oligopeptide/amino acid transporter permease protein [Francisellaceae bacterium]
MSQTLIEALLQTLYMVLGSTFLVLLIGLPSALLLWGMKINSNIIIKKVYVLIQFALKAVVPIPFIASMVLLIFLTKHFFKDENSYFIKLIPLTLGALPVFILSAEENFSKISSSLIEMSKSFGSSTPHLISKIVLSESWPNLVTSIKTTLLYLVSASAIWGAFEGGGLGEIVIHNGLYENKMFLASGTVLLFILLSVIIQGASNYITQGSIKFRNL